MDNIFQKNLKEKESEGNLDDNFWSNMNKRNKKKELTMAEKFKIELKEEKSKTIDVKDITSNIKINYSNNINNNLKNSFFNPNQKSFNDNDSYKNTNFFSKKNSNFGFAFKKDLPNLANDLNKLNQGNLKDYFGKQNNYKEINYNNKFINSDQKKFQTNNPKIDQEEQKDFDNFRQSKNNKDFSEPVNKAEMEYHPIMFKDEQIKFPYYPYEYQVTSIKEIYQVLKEKKQTIIFDSPTGSGKTQMLLSTLLHFIQNNDKLKKTKILYFTRTNSQMTQVLKEANKAIYNVTGNIMTSRKKLCLDKEVKNSGTLHEVKKACIKKTSQNLCRFKNKPNVFSKLINVNKNFDIEDLKQIGFENSVCPYYLSRFISKENNMIVMSYQYIINPSIRKNILDIISDNIIVFDEGHNIESVFEEACSFAFNIPLLKKILKEINEINNKDKLQEFYKAEDKNFESDVEKVEIIFNKFFLSVKKMIATINDWVNNHKTGVYEEGNLLTEFLDFSLISEIECELILKFIGSNKIETKCEIYIVFYFYFLDIFLKNRKNLSKYILLLDMSQTLNIICVSASSEFNKIISLDPKHVIVTSGTLKPYSDLENNLDHKFSGIINGSFDEVNFKKTIKCFSFDSYLEVNNNKEISFTYNNKDEERNINDFFLFLEQLKYPEKGGLLVFLPSYKYLEKFQLAYKKYHLSTFTSRTKIMFETKEKENQMKIFEQNIKLFKVVFFMVFGGKFSEGVDFKDDLARMIIILGIPFPNLQSMKIQSKKIYLLKSEKEELEKKQNQSKKEAFINFDSWYTIQAFLKINQALGRIKRHLNDYGVILFFDKRFKNNKYLSYIDDKFRNLIEDPISLSNFNSSLKSFFHQNFKQNELFLPQISLESDNNHMLKKVKTDISEKYLLDNLDYIFNHPEDLNKDDEYNNKQNKNIRITEKNNKNKISHFIKKDEDLNLQKTINKFFVKNEQEINTLDKKLKK